MTRPALTGKRCLCRGCGERFNSVKSFDRHRIDRIEGRRCLLPSEMRQRGMNLNRQGFWLAEPMRKHRLQASASPPTAVQTRDPVATYRGAR